MINSTVHDDDNDAGGCDHDGCTGNHIRYLMFDTITAVAAADDDNGGVGFGKWWLALIMMMVGII